MPENDYNLTHTGAELDEAIDNVINNYRDVSEVTANSGDVVLNKQIVTLNGVVTGTLDLSQLGGSSWYAVCTSESTAPNKEIVIQDITSLYEGLSIKVYFQYAQNFNGTPKLKLNNFDAIDIEQRSGVSAVQYQWNANEILDLCYCNNKWVIIDGGIASTDYYGYTKLTDSTSSTSITTSATPNSVKSAYDLANTANTTANNALPKSYVKTTLSGNETNKVPSVSVVKSISDSVTSMTLNYVPKNMISTTVDSSSSDSTIPTSKAAYDIAKSMYDSSIHIEDLSQEITSESGPQEVPSAEAVYDLVQDIETSEVSYDINEIESTNISDAIEINDNLENWPIKNLKVNIPLLQRGEGDPNPKSDPPNVRNIVSYPSISIRNGYNLVSFTEGKYEYRGMTIIKNANGTLTVYGTASSDVLYNISGYQSTDNIHHVGGYGYNGYYVPPQCTYKRSEPVSDANNKLMYVTVAYGYYDEGTFKAASIVNSWNPTYTFRPQVAVSSWVRLNIQKGFSISEENAVTFYPYIMPVDVPGPILPETVTSESIIENHLLSKSWTFSDFPISEGSIDFINGKVISNGIVEVLNGGEDWKIKSGSSPTGCIPFQIPIKFPLKPWGSAAGGIACGLICNRFLTSLSGYFNNDNSINTCWYTGSGNTTGTINFCIEASILNVSLSDSDETKLNAWKIWLSNNNTEIYLPYAVPLESNIEKSSKFILDPYNFYYCNQGKVSVTYYTEGDIKLTPGTEIISPISDNTLSLSGQAADAKTVGDEIQSIKGRKGDSSGRVFNAERVCTVKGYTEYYDQPCSMSDFSGQPWGTHYEDIKEVIINEGTLNISQNAFKNASNLTGIYIPSSVTSIGADAFSGCTSLTDVYYEGSVEAWSQLVTGTSEIPEGVNIHYQVTPIPEIEVNPVSVNVLQGTTNGVRFECKVKGENANWGTDGLKYNYQWQYSAFNTSNNSYGIWTDGVNSSSKTPVYQFNADSGFDRRRFRCVVTAKINDGSGDVFPEGSIFSTKTISSPATAYLYKKYNKDGNEVDIVDSGDNWELYECSRSTVSTRYYLLKITDDVDDYTESSVTTDAGWYKYKDNISRIMISENVSYIGSYAFNNFTDTYFISFLSKNIRLGNQAFGYVANSVSYLKVFYPGTLTDWDNNAIISIGNSNLYKKAEIYFGDIPINDTCRFISEYNPLYYNCSGGDNRYLAGSLSLDNGVLLISRFPFPVCSFQSFCITPNGYIIVGPGDGQKETLFSICEVDSNGMIIRHRKYPSSYDPVLNPLDARVTHGNGSTFNSDSSEIYICGARQVVAIDYNTLDISKVYSGSFTPTGLAYDNGTLYGKNSGDIYRLTLNSDSTFSYVNLFKVPYSNRMVSGQDIAVHNGYLYCCINETNQLFKVDINTGEFIESIIIGSGNGRIPYEEVESVDFKDDQMYMLSASFVSGYTVDTIRYRYNLGFTNIWKTNIGGPVYLYGPYGQGKDFEYTINVGNCYTANPGTEKYYCRSLNEAASYINYLSVNGWGHTFTINVYPYHDNSRSTCVLGNVTCTIDLQGTTIPMLDIRSSNIIIKNGTISRDLIVSKNSTIRLVNVVVNNIDSSDSTIIYGSGAKRVKPFKDNPEVSGLISMPVNSVLLIGDSIALGSRYNNSYAGDIVPNVLNKAIGGDTISSIIYNDIARSIENRQIIDNLALIKEFNPDAIIMEGGINDLRYGKTPLGNLSSSAAQGIPVNPDGSEYGELNVNEFTGALEHLFVTCIKYFPNTDRFFLITHKLYERPENHYWPVETNTPIESFTPYNQQQLHDRIVQCCNIYNVKVIDIYNDSQLNSYFDCYVSPDDWSTDNTLGETNWVNNDGIHPLKYGYLHGYVPLVRKALLGSSINNLES